MVSGVRWKTTKEVLSLGVYMESGGDLLVGNRG